MGCAVRKRVTPAVRPARTPLVVVAGTDVSPVRKISTDGRQVVQEPVARWKQRQMPLQTTPGALTTALPLYGVRSHRQHARSYSGLGALVLVATLCVLIVVGLFA